MDQLKFLTDQSRLQYWELMLIPTYQRNYYYNDIVDRLKNNK